MTAAGWEALYWAAFGCAAYTFAGYPAALAVVAWWRPKPVKLAPAGEALPTVSVVIAAHNEQAHVARRVRQFTRRVVEAGLCGEVVVVSDGSADATAEAARSAQGGPVAVTVIELAKKVGKAEALSVGCAAAVHEVIAFADARQTWANDALTRLLENFADPAVGAVSGEFYVESAPGVMAGVGLYWRFEKALRRLESRVYSTVGVTGAISAVRRSLFLPIPTGTVLDDVYWPLGVTMRGYRVVFDARARAFDRLPERVDDELRRKVRTLAGNFQLVARMPAALAPWRNPVWFALVSHKLMRLVVPWAGLAAAVAAWERGGPLYAGLLAAQAAATLAGVAGLVPWVASRSKVAGAAGSFLMLNAAAWLAFWVWASGRASRSWSKVDYKPVPALEGAAR